RADTSSHALDARRGERGVLSQRLRRSLAPPASRRARDDSADDTHFPHGSARRGGREDPHLRRSLPRAGRAPMTSSLLDRTLAWSVHLYTALGAVVALEAIISTVRGDTRGAFLWMAAALVIDSSDGTLARAARVKEVVPTYDGSKLDDIVDYLNYVFVP